MADLKLELFEDDVDDEGRTVFLCVPTVTGPVKFDWEQHPLQEGVLPYLC